jgi:hypothetical protein
MRGRHPRGYRRTPKVIALEQEFGEPLPDIIAGFAADGMTIATTAGALGYDNTHFYRLRKGLARAGHVYTWRDPYDREPPVYPNTPAQQAARDKALEQARVGSAARWATDAKGTPELVARATVLRAERLSWRAIAVRLGVDPSTLARARRKYPTPDPLGAELKRAAQRAFTQR